MHIGGKGPHNGDGSRQAPVGTFVPPVVSPLPLGSRQSHLELHCGIQMHVQPLAGAGQGGGRCVGGVGEYDHVPETLEPRPVLKPDSRGVVTGAGHQAYEDIGRSQLRREAAPGLDQRG
eukprot:CAMPEP_0179988538 /NCGR_PEP_ID=MMETSP0984-20121128/3351_1 /TAXON_ID=483367 /ORGANISM="non described non described, Strain CCMP 2436" /LENGTH=118 /DNA_ID=CAMNT_0021907461 /DNA_START=778 /DNA_END=1135 /DNA_ORIENTATION=+